MESKSVPIPRQLHINHSVQGVVDDSGVSEKLRNRGLASIDPNDFDFFLQYLGQRCMKEKRNTATHRVQPLEVDLRHGHIYTRT